MCPLLWGWFLIYSWTLDPGNITEWFIPESLQSLFPIICNTYTLPRLRAKYPSLLILYNQHDVTEVINQEWYFMRSLGSSFQTIYDRGYDYRGESIKVFLKVKLLINSLFTFIYDCELFLILFYYHNLTILILQWALSNQGLCSIYSKPY